MCSTEHTSTKCMQGYARLSKAGHTDLNATASASWPPQPASGPAASRHVARHSSRRRKACVIRGGTCEWREGGMPREV